jgi:hypothetical protein
MEITNTNWRMYTVQEMLDSGYKPENYLYEALELVKGYKHYFGFGTLLGFYRDKDFMLDDTDIDVEILDLDDVSEIESKFLNAGYTLIRCVTKDGLRQQSAFQKDKMIVDLAFFRREGEQYITYHEGGNYADPLSIEPFKTLDTKYGAITIPNDPEAYLKAHYGTWEVKSNDKSIKV